MKPDWRKEPMNWDLFADEVKKRTNPFLNTNDMSNTTSNVTVLPTQTSYGTGGTYVNPFQTYPGPVNPTPNITYPNTMNNTNQIYKKMVAVMKAIGPVKKSQKNQAQGYAFRGIDNFINALHPALIENGVCLAVNVIERHEEIKEVERSSGKKGVDKHVSVKVQYTFYAEDGSSITTTSTGEGLDSGDKATNKAMSAALKYALIQTFMVPTSDLEEADKVSPEMGVETPKSARTNKKPSYTIPVSNNEGWE